MNNKIAADKGLRTMSDTESTADSVSAIRDNVAVGGIPKVLGMIGLTCLLVACQSTPAPEPTSAVSRNRTSATQTGAQAAPAAQATVAPALTVAVDGALALTKPLITLSFESSGVISTVLVSPGKTVKKGDVMAEIDGAILDTAVQKAQEQLALKQAQIDSSLAPPQQTDIDAAKAALATAYASYNELKQGPSAIDVDSALRAWNQSKNSLYSNQVGRDQTCGIKPGYSSAEDWKQALTHLGCKQADMSVQSSETGERNAHQAYIDAQAGPTQEALTKSWTGVVQAQSSLDKLLAGVSDAQKKVYDLQLEQARLTIDRAKRDLTKRQLISPCTCVVQDVTLVPGAASGGNVTLLDVSQGAVRFQTSNLNERDVVNIEPGQAATLRLKAFEKAFTGKVLAIVPASSGTLGTVALYTAIIAIDPGSDMLLPGMTGQASINLSTASK